MKQAACYVSDEPADARKQAEKAYAAGYAQGTRLRGFAQPSSALPVRASEGLMSPGVLSKWCEPP
jgi:hypothetical protein